MPVRADVTVSTGTSGPLFGDGGTFTVTSSGSIGSVADSNGVVSQVGNTITTLTVDGVVVTGTAASGVRNFAGSTMSALNASGTIQGGWAIQNGGSIGSISNTGLIKGTREWAILGADNSSVGEFTNAGTIDSVKSGVGLWTTGTVANLAGGLIRSVGNSTALQYLNGVSTLFTNAGTITSGSSTGHGVEIGRNAADNNGSLTTAVNSGFIEGDSAMIVRQGMSLGTLTNSGTLQAVTYGLWIGGQAGTVSNLAGGLITATNGNGNGYAALNVSNNGSPASLTSLENAGRIVGDYVGVTTGGSGGIAALTNSGTISGTGWAGMDLYATGTMATLSNSGVITGWNGIDAARGTFTSLVNSGTISGTNEHGIINGAMNTISSLTNEASGLIHGTDAGLYVSSTTTAPMNVTNAGRITGSNAGVAIVNSSLPKLTNTGTIAFTGTGTGPAVRVGSGSVLGVASGTGGEALSSTGGGALLDGTIVNQGTVYYGFTVDNQDLTISASGGTGTFTSGTLKVTNGNLSFTSGTTTVAASVSANGGAGTVITDANATVRLIGLANLTADVQSFANSGALEFQQAVSGSLAIPISGTGSVLKTGTGNLVLRGTSSYTGATTVSAGRLSVNAALGNSPVMVLAAAELGGSGSIAGSVSVAQGGTLSPGNSIESLAAGATTFAAGATFEYEYDSTNPAVLAAAADLLVISGNLNLDSGNGTLLTLADLASSPKQFPGSTTFALVNYSGTWNGGLFTYGSNVLANQGLFTMGGQQWQINYASSTGGANFTSDYLTGGKFVTITTIAAIPEPSTLALLGAGAAAFGLARGRRRRRGEECRG